MPDPTHITVTAPEGRHTPIHPSDGVEPGGAQLFVTHGVVARVRYSQDVRRSIGRGDLVPCDMNGGTVGVALAAAPNHLPLSKVTLGAKDELDEHKLVLPTRLDPRALRDPKVEQAPAQHIPDPKKDSTR